MLRLFLLDGMALVYRAHFAFIQNPIRTSKGLNTSAVFGFTNTLLAILEGERPTHIAVAFDTPAPTPRHLLFPAYKAQRDAMPEELAAAIPVVKHLCSAFRIPVIERDGFEADDLIGTLAARAEHAGFETFMVTPDKDFAQLVSPTTRIWKPGRKGADHEIIDLPAVRQQWSVPEPARVADVLGLWGDSSDNIPGVPGIGEKTAKKLIAEFGSLDELLARTPELKGAQREKLESHADQARLCRQLATIVRDAPLDIPWDQLALTPPDDAAVRSIFAELEFRSLARRVWGRNPTKTTTPTTDKDATPPPTPAPADSLRSLHDVPHAYHLAATPKQQHQLLASLATATRLCLDTETTSLDRHQCELLGVALAATPGEAWFLPYHDALRPALAALLSNPAEKVGHNLKFDLAVLLNHGIGAAGPFFDTMLAHALVAPDQRHTMDHLAEALLGYATVKLADLAAANPPAPAPDPQADDLFSFAAARRAAPQLDMRAIPLATLAEYSAEDADVTLQLADKLAPLLADSGQAAIFRKIEAPLLPVLVRMEHEGVAVDLDALAAISVSLQQKIDGLAAAVRSHAGRDFNLNSPKQLGEILFDELQLAGKPRKTRTGQYKTDEQTLAALAGSHPIIDAILAYREAAKLKGTYVDALPDFVNPHTGRIHTHFHQLVASTGRLASSDPNLQNIPVRSDAGREIRKAFVPRSADFVLLSCDYSQVELRVMAALSGDPAMIDDFHAGRDIHAATAARVHHVAPDQVTAEMRRGAKMVNFGIIYGISAFGLAQRLGIPRTDAAALIDAYFTTYPRVREFMDETVHSARQHGWVATLSGRRRHLPDLNSANQNIRGNAERAAINTPIQGTAADMIKLAMVRVDALLRDPHCRSRMLLQVHDELVFDLHRDEQADLVPRILAAMRTALPLPNNVPVKVDHGTGTNWLDAH